MRADMSGAACVLGTMKAVSQLKLPINVIGKPHIVSYPYWIRHSPHLFQKWPHLAVS